MLSQYDDGKIESFDENMVADTVFRIKDVLNVSDVDFLKSVLERKLDAEFNEQVCNIFSKMMVKFSSRLRMRHYGFVENEGAVDIQNRAISHFTQK